MTNAPQTTTHTAACSCHGKKVLFIREVFVLFYLMFLGCAFLFFLSSGHPLLEALTDAARYTYAPAMLFAAGSIVGMDDPDSPGFQKRNYLRALTCLLLFWGLSFLEEVFLDHRALFSTVKDLLALLRIPIVTSIFLTLSAFFLLCAWFFKYIDQLFHHKKLLVLVCILGFACTLIPSGLLGYGSIGIFIGGDRYRCSPIAYYIPIIYIGILFGRDKIQNLLDRKLLLGIAGTAIAGLCFGFMHQQLPACVLLGAVLAYIGLLLCSLLLPLYSKCETGIVHIGHSALTFWKKIRKKQATSKWMDRLIYYVGYCLLFVIVAFLVFVPYIESGRTLIWSVDGLGQYVPKIYRFLSYIPSVFQDLLHGSLDFQQYDFTSGLGSTVSISYDPIYWLYLLFSPSQIEEAYSILILLRYFLCGISMSAMLRYFRKPNWSAYLGSIFYTFSGYAIYAGTKHGQFLTPMILLPILVIAMEELITKGKWYLLTIFTALSLLCSYYFLYMNTIALGIYFVTRILCTKEYRNLKTFFTKGFTIVGSYLLAAAIGCITLFTSFGGYVGSSRSGGSSISSFISRTPLFYRNEWIPDSFISFISDSFTPGNWLKLGFAPLAMLALVLLFTRNRKKELKPIFLILTTFCFIPFFGYMLNGFSNVSNRWCYIYAVLITFILVEYVDSFRDLSHQELCIMTGMTLLYGGIIFFSTKYRLYTVFGAFGLLASTLILVFILNDRRFHLSARTGKILLLGMTTLSVVLNANWFIMTDSGKQSHLETYVPVGESLPRMSNTALRYLDELTEDEPEEFYRSTNLKTTGYVRSSSLIYGYNDLSTFSSTLSGSIIDYNTQMGNIDYNIVSIYSYNFRTYLHELASVRYLGNIKGTPAPLPYGYEKVLEKEQGNTVYEIYENQYTLPLGYTYSNVISEEEVQDYSAAEKQELTMLSAIVSEKDLAEDSALSTEVPALTTHKLDISDTELNGVTVEGDTIKVEEDSSITFHFEGEPNAETYLSFCGDIKHPHDGAEHFLKLDVIADGVTYAHKFRVDAYSTGQEEYLFNLGYHKEAINSCTLKFKSKGTLQFSDISVYSQSMDTYADRVNALSEDVLENVTTEKNTVTGTITTEKPKLLVLSLPYQSGWTAYVDGKEVDLQKVNYQYMGISLPAGHHTIRLHYQLPGLKYALIITAGGIILFLLIIIVNHIRAQHGQKKRR